MIYHVVLCIVSCSECMVTPLSSMNCQNLVAERQHTLLFTECLYNLKQKAQMTNSLSKLLNEKLKTNITCPDRSFVFVNNNQAQESLLFNEAAQWKWQ